MHRLIEASTSPLQATTSISVLPPGEVKFESCLGGVGNLKRHSPLFSWNTRVLSFNMGVFKQVNDQFCEQVAQRSVRKSRLLIQPVTKKLAIKFQQKLISTQILLRQAGIWTKQSLKVQTLCVTREGGCIDVEASN